MRKFLRFKRIVMWLMGIPEKYTLPENVYFSITVVIPAYNEEGSIADTIESIKKQTYPVDRILVVDDCSSDRTGEIARKAGVEVVRTSKNSGTKAQTQNYGIQFVDTDLVATIDADTLLDPKAIEKVVPCFVDKKVAATCGFIIPQKIKTKWEKARFIEYLFGIFIFKEAQNLWGAPIVSSGCFSVFSNKILKEFGGFPDRSIAEDMDLTWQQLENGYRVIVVPDARCYPIEPHNYPIYRRQVERWLRGFLQNVKAHKLKLLKNKRLAFFISWCLFDALTFPVSLVFMVLIALHFGWFALTIPLMDVAIVTSSALWVARKEKKVGLALRSIPWYYAIRPINAYLFFKSVWKEWFVQDQLRVWEKGH